MFLTNGIPKTGIETHTNCVGRVEAHFSQGVLEGMLALLRILQDLKLASSLGRLHISPSRCAFAHAAPGYLQQQHTHRRVQDRCLSAPSASSQLIGEGWAGLIGQAGSPSVASLPFNSQGAVAIEQAF